MVYLLAFGCKKDSHITCSIRTYTLYIKETQPLNSSDLTLLFELVLNLSARLRLDVGLKRHWRALFPTVSAVKVGFSSPRPVLFYSLESRPLLERSHSPPASPQACKGALIAGNINLQVTNWSWAMWGPVCVCSKLLRCKKPGPPMLPCHLQLPTGTGRNPTTSRKHSVTVRELHNEL